MARFRPLLAHALPCLALLTSLPAAEGSAPAAKKERKAAAPTPGELVLHKWSGAINVPDPVAVAVDPQGRVYVTATTRRKVADLDIREHPMWIPDDVGLTSIDEKAAFLRRELAPGRMRAPRGGIQDHNKDGSIDWKDLTFHTERIYQLTDTDGDGTADRITVFAEGFNTEVTGIAAGVMVHDGWVYATIAPDLWRFKDNDGDGVADVREIVAHGFGLHLAYAGHDMHGLTVGPDGRIYWSIGDKGVNVTSREGRNFYFPNEGCILRVEPDGSNFEVYAHGVRNPQEPAFDAFGDLFAVDNDADMKGERERFVYLPEASDSGWRCNFQYMKEASPWMREGLWQPTAPSQPTYLLPPILSYSDGPAGFRHDPGTALGEAQRGLFILNEFPSGKMRAFRTERDGASFRMVDARILSEGIMGIGLSWHPDGSLLLADWMGGYPLDGLGAVWRVDTRDTRRHPQRQETGRLLAAGFERTDDPSLLALLAHPDQRVRQGAQLELAKRNRGEALAGVAAEAKADLFARLHAIWGYGQLLRRRAAPVATVLPLLRDPHEEIRRQAARILGDAASTGAQGQGTALVPLLADASPRVRALAAIALGRFAEPSAVAPLVALAARDAAASPVLRHAAVTGLTGCATPEQLAALHRDPSVPVRLAGVVALRRLRHAAVTAFLTDADPRVVQEAALAIHDERGIPDALPALAALAARPPSQERIALRAVNANLRLGTREAAARLLTLALDAQASPEWRAEALTALRLWQKPPRLDLVDGHARTFVPAPIGDLLTPRLPELLALTDARLKTLAIEIMIAHALPAAPAQIAAIVADASAGEALRAQSLRLLAAQPRRDPAADRAIATGLADQAPGALRRAALELVATQDTGRLVDEARKTFTGRPLPEQQHVIALLAQAGSPAADALLGQLGDTLVHGTCAPGLRLDILSALQARAANADLAAKARRYATSKAGQAQEELLAGGDAGRGREVVLNHLNANCTACHAVEGAGGSEVGPNLRTIGAQRAPAYLLESLLVPSAQIATGYGLVNVTLRDRTEITGTLASETKEAVTVRRFDGSRVKVPRADIASQSPAISVMPAMGAILQPGELRDVVAYLAGLKGGRTRGGEEN